MIFCNTRILNEKLTGVQRYTTELLSRMNNRIGCISPTKRLDGIKGHFWEQVVLPSRLGNNLLWSPSNTGPLCVENQVVSIMDLSPLDHPEWTSKKFSLWYQFLIPKLVSRVKGIITISEFSRTRILNFCPEAKHKIHVTHLAADKRFSPVDKTSVSHMVQNLKLPSKKYIVALGSLEPRKNLHTLLKAWEHIHTKLPHDTWLVLAGAKGKSSVFGSHSYCNLPPRVHLTGHVADDLLPALYTGALATIYLSYYEGFGLPPLEAMSCGSPVLVSNTTSLPEVVADSGLTVDPFDVDAISGEIFRLVFDSTLQENLRLKGVERAKHFNWDKTAEETMRILVEAAR